MDGTKCVAGGQGCALLETVESRTPFWVTALHMRPDGWLTKLHPLFVVAR